MITKENLKEHLSTLDLSTLSVDLKENIESLRDITEEFTDFSITDNDQELGKFLELTIADLNKHVQLPETIKTESQPESNEHPVKPVKSKKQKSEKQKVKKENINPGAFVEVVRPEIKFIKRFVNMEGHDTISDRILAFITSLQRAIRNKAIRKDSPYAEQIMHIQKELISAWHKNRDSKAGFKIEFEPKDKQMLESYQKIATSEQPIKAVALIKRFISLEGKDGVMEKAKKLREDITKYMKEKNHILSDQLINALLGVEIALRRYIEKNSLVVNLTEQGLSSLKGLGILDFNHKIKKGDLVRTFDNRRGRVKKVHDKTVEIEGAEGHYYAKKKVKVISQANKGCSGPGCESLNGPGDPDTINSTDLSNMQFNRVGFTGKWLSLIGDPSEPWLMMCWSKPGKGKTTLMIEFSKYLAEVHGRKVLFIAKEEGLNYTLKEKFERLDAMHPLITISTIIPDDLSPFNYVVIDSVTKFKLSTDELEKLKENHPNVSFIFIFQSTIDGNYRGDKDAEHLVDVSIAINDEGYAKCSKTRYGGQGTINVFPRGTEMIYRFPTLQEAERYRAKNPHLAMLKGDDRKIWLTTAAKAAELTEQGYEIIHF